MPFANFAAFARFLSPTKESQKIYFNLGREFLNAHPPQLSDELVNRAQVRRMVQWLAVLTLQRIPHEIARRMLVRRICFDQQPV